jgi:hypothetical protein
MSYEIKRFSSGLALAVWILATGLALPAGAAGAEAAADSSAELPVEKRRPITLTRKGRKYVRGVVLSMDRKEIILRKGEQKVTVTREELVPKSIYLARRSMLDRTSAPGHLELGELALKLGLERDSRREFAIAVRQDPKLKAEVQKIKQALARAQAASISRTASEAEIKANREKAQAWAKYAKKNINRNIHLVESDHFWIYSAWNRNQDKALKDICEKVNATLCKQFNIPVSHNIWAGKCAVYVFWEKRDYQKFSVDVVKFERGAEAGGFCGYRGDFVFVVMGPARSKAWFTELLVHETTHAFIARYRSSRSIASWVNEGVAEFMCSTLLPRCNAVNKVTMATREAARQNKPIAHVFEAVGLNSFDYGIAQSLVRYLIARDRKAFIEFFDLLKLGKRGEDGKRSNPLDTEAALQEAYGLNYKTLEAAWRKAIR